MKLKEAFRQNGNERLLKTTERSLFWYHRISRSVSSNRLPRKIEYFYLEDTSFFIKYVLIDKFHPKCSRKRFKKEKSDVKNVPLAIM